MPTNVKYFRSTMGNAPALTGQVGTLIALLDACLINGVNSLTLTSITRSGSTATATKTAHGFTDKSVLTIAGANETEYNGVFRITVPDANTFTYTVSGTPDTPATGTITAKVSPLGFAKEFSGTNLAAYRGPNVAGTRLRLRIDDTNAQYGLARGYETMSDINTGTGPFPTVAQLANGVAWKKSNASDANARPWVLFGDDCGFYLFVDWANADYWAAYAFGDFTSYKASDVYNCLIVGHSATAPADAGASQGFALADASTTTGQYVARSYTELAGATAFAKSAHRGGTLGRSGLGYPNLADNGLHLTPLILEETSAARGVLRGLWAPINITNGLFSTGDVSVDSPDGLSGRTLMAVRLACSGPAAGNLWADITGDW